MDDLVSLDLAFLFSFYASLIIFVIMKNFSRHRQSIVDIQQELHDIFRGHPQCYDNLQGVASLPARCLSDVFDTYREEYGVEATPDTILQLVAMRTSSGQQLSPEDLANPDDGNRGRADERDDRGRHS